MEVITYQMDLRTAGERRERKEQTKLALSIEVVMVEKRVLKASKETERKEDILSHYTFIYENVT